MIVTVVGNLFLEFREDCRVILEIFRGILKDLLCLETLILLLEPDERSRSLKRFTMKICVAREGNIDLTFN